MVVFTEAPIERVENALRSIEGSGKVKIHTLHSRQVKPAGRPEEVKREVIEFLQTQKKGRSAIQIARKIERPQTSLYRILNALAAQGVLEKTYDLKWRVNRFSYRPD